MFIEVINIKSTPRVKLTTVQQKMFVPIFRGKSCLGNPYNVYIYGRDECIERFKNHLYHIIENDTNSEIVNELNRLKKLAIESTEENPLKLVCFCAPLNCHGNIIRDYLLNNNHLQED